MSQTFEVLSKKIVAQGDPHIAQTHNDATETSHANGLIHIRHQPNRRCLLKALHKPGCPFCRDRATYFLVEYPYLGLLLSQNLAPYHPMSLVLRSRLHYQQDEIIGFLRSHGRNILSDLPANTTVFCNQFAGNSQGHLHIQYLGRLLPIANVFDAHKSPHQLDWQATPYDTVQYTRIDGISHSYNAKDHPSHHFLGCLLTGTAPEIILATTHYLQQAEKLGHTRFNFAAWRIGNSKQLTMYIVLRNPETLRTRHAQFPVLVGALTVCGLITEERLPLQMSPFDYEAFIQYMRTKTLPPINPWA
jgi:hypothetical protein